MAATRKLGVVDQTSFDKQRQTDSHAFFSRVKERERETSLTKVHEVYEVCLYV